MKFFKNILFLILFGSQVHAAEGAVIKKIAVEPLSESSVVASVIPFKVDEPFDPQLLDISKRLLVATEKFDRVDLHWSAEDQRLAISVSPKLYFENIIWKGDEVPDQSSIQKMCVLTNESRDPSQERISQITRCLMQELQGRSFLDAQVSLEPEGSTLTIHVILGTSYLNQDIQLIGAKSVPLSHLTEKISNQIGQPFQPLNLDSDTKEIIKIYLKNGFYFVEVFKPSTEINTETKKVTIIWRIKESRKIDLRFTGSYSGTEYLDKLIDREEAFPSWFVEEIVDEIESDFKAQGYLDTKVKSSKEVDEANGTEYITIDTRLGSVYRLTEPEWIAVNDKRAIEKIYSIFNQLRPGSRFKEAEYRSTINEDMTNLMISMGYIDAQVRGIDFIIDREKALVRPIITLNEGDIFLIQESSITGVPPGFEKNQDFKDLQKSLKVGIPFDRIKIDQLQTDAARSLVNAGYLDATITRESSRTATGLVVHEKVLAGPQYRVEKILIRGAIKTNYDTLRREVLLKAGDVFDEDKIQDSISQLLRLGIARSVDIVPLEKNPEKAEVYVLVDISESPRFRFEMGPGYGTLDGIRATFRGTWANIGGRARRLTLYAKGNRELGSSNLPADPTITHPQAVPFVERRVTLEYFEPSLFYLPVDGRLIFTHSKTNEKPFALFKNAFTAAVDYRLNRRWMFSTHYDIEFSDAFNILKAANTTEEDAKKRLTSIGQIVNIDYVDDTFNPTRGSRSRLAFDLYDHRLGGERNFWLGTAKNSIFLPIWTIKKGKSFGLSLAVQTGFSGPYLDTKEVPVEKRFRLGGENSVRGFGEKSINPKPLNGQIFDGGDSFFSFMSELHIPLFYGIDLLGFFDGGNVYRSNRQFHPWDLRYGAGPGFQWCVPTRRPVRSSATCRR
ncbi:MAG: BamA/TamA family outer membrane protein [Deltaproteobacteria bacterium]|nr:BamA/TamA family outer membrane protein [Deltaproteobacteria bacterium]